MQSIESLYCDHIYQLQSRYDRLLDEQGYDGLLIHAGSTQSYYLDDNHRPFKTNPHLLAWAPLTHHPECCLLIRPGYAPRLFYYNPTDFWYKPAGAPDGFWTKYFDIEIMDKPDQVSRGLEGNKNIAFFGERADLAEKWGLTDINPKPLLSALHWYRACKTDYEVECLRRANDIAAKGHLLAERTFRNGASEFEIQMAYLSATRQRESELPYGNIVALNENASVLHYQYYQCLKPDLCHSFLIDAGAAYNGYASDVTRTYCQDIEMLGKDDSGARNLDLHESVFSALIDALDSAQQRLIGSIKPGQSFIKLHQQMCLDIGAILQQHKLVNASAEAQLHQGILRAFFPHGLGHLLGLQVHDVGGLQADANGTPALAPDDYPFLRLTRTLETGMVFTIEPGIYLIDSLLAELKAGSAASAVNWSMVDSLRPFGGIRIEDNIHLTASGCENLTRNSLAALGKV
ncbi:Xaa-Pro dipeptidase [Motiliproteus sp. MSK22-1]|nr:Xaa-Pro dipeptidase [Motiliproteus sp. MSK22-1]